MTRSLYLLDHGIDDTGQLLGRLLALPSNDDVCTLAYQKAKARPMPRLDPVSMAFRPSSGCLDT